MRSFVADKWGFKFDSETTGFIYFTSETVDSGGGQTQRQGKIPIDYPVLCDRPDSVLHCPLWTS